VDVVPDDEVLEDVEEIKEQKREQEKQKICLGIYNHGSM
jgi:hypothetical protein